MIPSLLADAMQYLFGILLLLTTVFLILLVLIQRGRGGGLAGAFGGMGGQSAFGTKAGDLFTRVTIVVASVWILLCMASVLVLSKPSSRLGGGTPEGPAATAPGDILDEDGSADAEGQTGGPLGGLSEGGGTGTVDESSSGTEP